MGVMKRWATAKMFGKDSELLALYGPTRKPKKEPKPPKPPKKPKSAKGQKELGLEIENGENQQPDS